MRVKNLNGPLTGETGKEKARYTLEDFERELEREKKKKIKSKKMLATVILAVAMVLIILLNVFTSLLSIRKVTGNAMEPLLYDGDLVLVSRKASVAQGDVVAFRYGSQLLVRRLIAGPERWVELDDDGVFRIDGDVLEESYIAEHSKGLADFIQPFQVSQDSWFVAGDNREYAVDSRNMSIGDVSGDRIYGKVVFVVWPLSHFGKTH